MAQNPSSAEEKLENIELGLSNAEAFIEKHQKNLIYAGIAVILLVAGAFAYKYWYRVPLEEEAQAQLFQAEQMFEIDSLRMALEGDGSFLGFIDVADRYSSTAAGNAACYYAGLSYLHLGQYEDALTFLKKYSGKGVLGKALALGNIGDAYAELENLDEAVRYYKKAAEASDNNLTAPRYLLKAGLVLEKQEKYADAIKLYEQIQHEFADITEAKDVEKYIARVKILLTSH